MEDTYSALARTSNPDVLKESLIAHADDLREAAHAHHMGPLTSVRSISHRGHEIVIRTTYEITVDGEPFDAHVTVDNAGRVHYHGLPTRDFPSTVDLVKKAIDYFPVDFGPERVPDDEHAHCAGGHHHGGGH